MGGCFHICKVQPFGRLHKRRLWWIVKVICYSILFHCKSWHLSWLDGTYTPYPFTENHGTQPIFFNRHKYFNDSDHSLLNVDWVHGVSCSLQGSGSICTERDLWYRVQTVFIDPKHESALCILMLYMVDTPFNLWHPNGVIMKILPQIHQVEPTENWIRCLTTFHLSWNLPGKQSAFKQRITSTEFPRGHL